MTVMIREYVIRTDEPAASGTPDYDLAHGAETASIAAPTAPGIPMTVPRAQLYYWSTLWQEEESAALEELARGEGREFKNAAEAIRWLLEEDDNGR